ncbi:MAG: ShlB/FhaC/HecB family hemolysin secretion/activation protein [Planctomycetes bacterium]|nr:ShlB/FhaC/HecB family hemolysin secretion/activation protein [Planctomycetota bacterium]
MNRKSFFRLGLVCSFTAASVWLAAVLKAEEAPTRDQLQQEVERLRQELQQLRDEFRQFQDAYRRGLKPAVEKVAVSGFDVQGSSLNKDDFDNALRPLTQKKLTPEELQIEVNRMIQELYSAKGVRGVQIGIPPQALEGGQPLVVQVVEPKLGNTAFEGNRFFSEKNLRRFFEGKIANAEGLLNARDLETQLDRANRHPDRQITAILKPGEGAGVSDVTFNVRERKPFHTITPFHYAIEVNNSGTPNTGRMRVEQTFQYTNLFDRDQTASIFWQFNPGKFDQVQVVGTSYVIPISTTGHSVSIYGGYSAINTDTVIDTLAITGEGYTVGLQGIMEVPEFWGFESKVSLGVEYTQINNALEFGTFTDIRSDVGLLPLYVRYNIQKRDAWGATFAYFGMRYNWGGVVPNGDRKDFEEFREEATPSFFNYRLGFERYQKIVAGWTWNVRADGQYTNDDLIPAEQFRAGGVDSVRGYEQSEISGDRGFFIRSELRSAPFPPLVTRFTKNKTEVLQAVGFVDYGIVRLDDPISGDPTYTDIAGAGVGLRYQLWEYFLARIDAAWAIMEGSQTDSGESIIYFSAQLNF